ncbi:MAG: hypothetical protein M5R36_16515 [Deltaproteobacteria bacterium]|nr:hypothetical protein [Deltaproteobacteria bacterium]
MARLFFFAAAALLAVSPAASAQDGPNFDWDVIATKVGIAYDLKGTSVLRNSYALYADQLGLGAFHMGFYGYQYGDYFGGVLTIPNGITSETPAAPVIMTLAGPSGYDAVFGFDVSLGGGLAYGGYTTNTDLNGDAFLNGFFGDGDPDNWSYQHDGGGEDCLLDVKIVEINAFATGYLTGPDFEDVFVGKFNLADGTLQWHKTWNSALGGYDRGLFLVPPLSGGGIIVGGQTSTDPPNPRFGGFVRELDGDGNTVREAAFDDTDLSLELRFIFLGSNNRILGGYNAFDGPNFAESEAVRTRSGGRRGGFSRMGRPYE